MKYDQPEPLTRAELESQLDSGHQRFLANLPPALRTLRRLSQNVICYSRIITGNLIENVIERQFGILRTAVLNCSIFPFAFRFLSSC
jgi:hypothetical protein